MKDMIILENVKQEKILLEGIANTTASVEVA